MSERIIVVEDDSFTRAMISDSMKASGFELIGSFADAPSALRICREQSPWACVLDLHLGPGPTGIDLAIAIRKLDPYCGVVILSSYEEPRFLRANLPPPPQGTIYLHKKSVSESRLLVDALFRSKVNATNGFRAELVRARGLLSRLTDSQLETLRLLCDGLSNAEIANKKFVTEKSIEISISRIAKTLGIHRDRSTNLRVQIVRAYYEALRNESRLS